MKLKTFNGVVTLKVGRNPEQRVEIGRAFTLCKWHLRINKAERAMARAVLALYNSV